MSDSSFNPALPNFTQMPSTNPQLYPTAPPTYEEIVEQPSNPYLGYQFIVVVDVSGSMNEQLGPEHNFITRIEFVHQQIGHLCADLNKYDTDGLDLVLFGTDVVVKKIPDKKSVTKIFNEIHAHGQTNTLEAILQCEKLHDYYKLESEKTQKLFKGTVVLFITDGEPQIENVSTSHFKKNIKRELERLSNKIHHHSKHLFNLFHKEKKPNDETKQPSLHLQFLQVGNDAEATKFLLSIDHKRQPELRIVHVKNFDDLSDNGKLSLAKLHRVVDQNL